MVVLQYYYLITGQDTQSKLSDPWGKPFTLLPGTASDLDKEPRRDVRYNAIKKFC